MIGDPAVRIGGEAGSSRDVEASIRRDEAHRIRPDVPHAGVTPPGALPMRQAGAPAVTGDGHDATSVDYRWFGRGKDGEPGVLAQLGLDMIHAMRQLVSDALSLEVQTFAGDHEGARAAAASAPDGARPSAYTRCAIDGDMVLCVPVGKDGVIDEGLWRIHEAAVAQAQKHRRDMLELFVSLLPGVTI